MKTKLLIPFLLLSLVSTLSAEVVNSGLGRDLKGIFPELSDGYIDLNNNGTADQMDDFNEIIPESAVKDGIIQVQEILDFIEEYFRYIPMDKLLSINNSLNKASGAIPEIISLNYSAAMTEILEKKAELDGDGLYLTPSALKEANITMQGYIASMLLAYKKENNQSESEFIVSRDKLFSMIVAGYPLPDLNDEDKRLLISAMIHTIITEKNSQKERVKAAIKTLGRIKAESAMKYLVELIDSPDYRIESIRALGNIGSENVLPLLLDELSSSEDETEKNAVIYSLGKIGGTESLSVLLSLLPGDAVEEGVERVSEETEKAVLKAVSDIAAGGSSDRRILNVITGYLKSEDPAMRILATKGFENFKGTSSASLLIPMLKSEKNEEVKIEIARILNEMNSPATISAFIGILNGSDGSDSLKKEIITAVGNNQDGMKGILSLLTYLGNPSSELRTAASEAILKLYSINGKPVVLALARGLIGSKDRLYQTVGSSILARIADPDSVNTLITLLQSSFPDVKKNATWALYRIRPAANSRIIEELKKLTASETESLEVRTNAVRALGVCAVNFPSADVWKILMTTAKMRGEKYTMLRFYAIRSMGELKTSNDDILDTLGKIAEKDSSIMLKREAVSSIRRISSINPQTENSLAALFRSADDEELRIRIVETFGDMGSEQTENSAEQLIAESTDLTVKKRAVYALSKTGRETAFSIILDASADSDIREYAANILQDANPETMISIISKRLKTENNGEIISVMESLRTGFDDSY